MNLNLHPHAHHSPLRKLVGDTVGSALVMANLLFLVAAVLILPFPKFEPRRRRFLAASACAIPAAVFGAAVITRKDVVTKEVDIAFPNLPSGLRGLRLLQISDIHIGTFYSAIDLRRVVDACNNLRADMAFVTGDLITDEHDPLDQCLAELRRLKSGTTVWGCMGNHELYSGCEAYVKQAAARFGMDFLRYENRTLRFGDSKLNLMGIDYPRHSGAPTAVAGMVQPDDFNLLLSHTPALFPQAAKMGVDLTLSGHTHGGQLNLPIAGMNINPVDLITPYTKGLYRDGRAAVYVNSGLGTIGVPMRIGAPPEITVIRLCNS